jgi:hypothetical protein
MRKIFESFISEINSGGSGSGSKPLSEVCSSAEADFQYLPGVVSRELCKRMDERLIRVAPLLNLFKVLASELFRLGILRFTTLAVPKRLYLTF